MEINVAGKSYSIKALEHETDKTLSTRLWFIIKQNPENDIDFQETEKWSILWYYMTYFKCRYDDKIETRVKDTGQKHIYLKFKKICGL